MKRKRGEGYEGAYKMMNLRWGFYSNQFSNFKYKKLINWDGWGRTNFGSNFVLN